MHHRLPHHRFPLSCCWFGVIYAVLLGNLSRLHAEEISFSRDIQPILSDNCFQCHGPDESARQAGLRLDRKDDLLESAGASSGKANLDESELLRRITTDDPDEVMPPRDTKQSLSQPQIQRIKDWISQGAVWEGHWAFESPRRPAPPRLDPDDTSTKNAIDRFIAARLQSLGLDPSPPASREKLLRRVSLDLTGLPPTLQELDRFVADRSPNAYEEAVDRLLASPRFGEAMAMDWLDAARYADTNGYQGDRERTMWPWRDWVIDAFNRDLPYDEFTVWQLAGDQIPNATHEQKLATGFCRNHMINGEGGRIAEENRVEYVFDQIETLGTVWLGLTMQCCRCHDHKFDPITQSEYYKLFAFFNQTPVNGGGGDPQMAPNMTVPSWQQTAELQSLERTVAEHEHLLSRAEEQVANCDSPEHVAKALKKKIAQRNNDEWKQLEEHFADQNEFVRLAQNYRDSKSRLEGVQRAIPKVMIMRDMAKDKNRETFILDKGLYNQKRKTVSAATPSFLPNLTADEPDDDATPNRLDLAHWLTSPDHPLTARVTVNRLWQKFFGTGIVKTSDDFGVQGEKPTHPQLLDWLAVELIDSGWDLKHVVRLIVTSSTYRQTANLSSTALQIDPENRFLSRGPRRRLPAWMIRDQALAMSGLLAGNLGGASVKSYQPEGIWAEASFGNKRYQQDHGEALYRRSLYIYWRRIVGPTVFFDMSKRQTCSVKGSQTNTPLHALVTLNDVTYVEAARMMAWQLLKANQSDKQRIEHAFRLATSRFATPKETLVLLDRLKQLREHFKNDELAASELTQVGEMATDELPYAELSQTELSQTELSQTDLAAYTTVCLLVMNLDEALNK